jgi:dihydrolipoamide dehydrogenase
MAVNVVVIGGGPAGVEAARAAASAGAVVTVVCDESIGGRAGWHSLLPSKVWLNTADVLSELSRAPHFGIESLGSPRIEVSSILKRITSMAESWSRDQEKSLRDLGVDIVQGFSSFVSDREIQVKNSKQEVTTQFRGDAFIVATGSIPQFPPGLKPDGKLIIAPRLVRRLDTIPASVVVIGAGATGAEFVSLFSYLGAEVTWIVDDYGILPTFDEEAGQTFRRFMENRGVRVIEPTVAENIDSGEDGVTVHLSHGDACRAAMAFVAIGRNPDLSRLNLDAAGLRAETGGSIALDPYGRTAKRWIYLVGDSSGSPMVANRAMTQAWTAGRHAAGAKVEPFRPDTVVHAVYSNPEVAQVGNPGRADTLSLSYQRLLRSQLSDCEGFIKLGHDEKQKITGAVAVGSLASDMLAPVAVAIRAGLTLDDLAAVSPAHPTLSELPFLAARMFLNKGSAPG